MQSAAGLFKTAGKPGKAAALYVRPAAGRMTRMQDARAHHCTDQCRAQQGGCQLARRDSCSVHETLQLEAMKRVQTAPGSLFAQAVCRAQQGCLRLRASQTRRLLCTWRPAAGRMHDGWPMSAALPPSTSPWQLRLKVSCNCACI